MKKQAIVTGLSILLTGCSLVGCGGGGSTASNADPVTPAPPVSTPWALTAISNAGNVPTAGSACGSYDIVAAGDLNNDGNDDILIGPKVKFNTTGCTTSAFSKPIMALYDPVTKSYNINVAIQMALPEMQW